ncbi:hypothetical protein [Massilia sp. Root351]|jgi:hypothetical protein|uniref:hypothetical protein n=1 Tax=Massilia sp. Root351 TaxID=1736522 RepID=UPI0012F675C1|nr:hypothetical protein [Massilia sp. Root351]
MLANIHRSDLVAHSIAGSGVTDSDLLGEFEAYPVSYNAEAAFCGYLSVACEIAAQRPHLLGRLLPKAIDAAYCMGVDSAEGFIAYASSCIDKDALHEPEHRQFSPEASAHFRRSLNGHLTTIQAVLMQIASRHDE